MRLFFIILFCGLTACIRVNPGFVESSNGTTEDQYVKAGWPQYVQGQYLEVLKAWEQQFASGKVPKVPMMIHMATTYGVRGHQLMRSGDLGSARKAFRRQSDLLLSAGERGSPSAFEQLTMVYIQGNGVPLSKEEYRSVLEKANLGDGKAQYRLSLHELANTKGQWHKIVFAKKWMDKSATRGYPGATVSWPFVKQYVDQKIEEELDKGKEALRSHQEEVAFQLYHALARTGNAEAQARLGALYLKGQGVSRNVEQALTWIQKSVQKGNVTGACLLGLMNQTGSGVPRNRKLGREFILAAAQRGAAACRYWVGNAYAKGQGVVQDVSQAWHWWNLAAASGDTNAQYEMGIRYQTGNGVEQNLPLARKWLQHAVDGGLPMAREPLQAVNVLIAEGQRPRMVDGPTCLKEVLDFRLLGMKPTQDGELKFKLEQSARVKNLTNYYVMFQARIHYSGNVMSQGYSHSPTYPVNIHKRSLLYILPRANAAEWTFPVRKVYRWVPRAQWKIQAELEEDQSSCYLYSVPPAHWDPDHPSLF